MNIKINVIFSLSVIIILDQFSVYFGVAISHHGEKTFCAHFKEPQSFDDEYTNPSFQIRSLIKY